VEESIFVGIILVFGWFDSDGVGDFVEFEHNEGDSDFNKRVPELPSKA